MGRGAPHALTAWDTEQDTRRYRAVCLPVCAGETDGAYAAVELEQACLYRSATSVIAFGRGWNPRRALVMRHRLFLVTNL